MTEEKLNRRAALRFRLSALGDVLRLQQAQNSPQICDVLCGNQMWQWKIHPFQFILPFGFMVRIAGFHGCSIFMFDYQRVYTYVQSLYHLGNFVWHLIQQLLVPVFAVDLMRVQLVNICYNPISLILKSIDPIQDQRLQGQFNSGGSLDRLDFQRYTSPITSGYGLFMFILYFLVVLVLSQWLCFWGLLFIPLKVADLWVAIQIFTPYFEMHKWIQVIMIIVLISQKTWSLRYHGYTELYPKFSNLWPPKVLTFGD